MSPIRLCVLLLILALSFAVCGCFGGGGGDSQASSKRRFGLRKKSDVAKSKKRGSKARGGGDADEYSPEGSMERDLKQLQGMEQAQLKKIKSMQNDLSQGSDMVRREEEKLRDIRGKIQRYDTAMQRYEMASRARPPREDYGQPAVVPASQFQDRPVNTTRAGYNPNDGRYNNSAAYEQRPPSNPPPRRSSRSAQRGGPIVNEGETLLYAPGPGESQPMYSTMAPPAQSYGRGDTMQSAPAPYASAPAGRPSGPPAPQYAGNNPAGNNSSPFISPPPPASGAPAQYGMPPPSANNRPTGSGEGGWAPSDSLFSNSANQGRRFPDPEMTQRSKKADTYWPEPPASNRNAAPTPTVRLPSAAAAPVASAPAAPSAGGSEEVFMPDMFLTGGR